MIRHWKTGWERIPGGSCSIEPQSMITTHCPSTDTVTTEGRLWSSSRAQKDGSLEDTQLSLGLETVYCVVLCDSLDIWKDDSIAFIFTLKNPHGVPPTRFLKRRESYQAISCDPEYGPVFGTDIYINNHCNIRDSCSIANSGDGGYRCHPKYGMSLFVNTDYSDVLNYFTVLDYEVFCRK